MDIPNPVIVVEVLSPGTAADDDGVKLDGYFSLKSVEGTKRAQACAIETRILREGAIRLDPPGIEAEVATFFAAE